jgi:hypothetical protein
MVTVHVPVPEQPPPLHPVNVDPVAGVAVRVTIAPSLNMATHVGAQPIPVGALPTLPEPVPLSVTVRVCVIIVNVARTDSSALMVTMHVVDVPEQPPPLHPANVECAPGVSVSVTTVPLSYSAEHVGAQLIALSPLVTDPGPVPAVVTVSVCTAVKVAVTDASALIVTMHVPVPEQPPPLQPANLEPAAGVAVSVTTVPWL